MLRGVNLGGWLVLEKWMAPSLFAGLAAGDETGWCVELGSAAAARRRAHWDAFIGREDFAWLAAVGVTALRIPVGHWIFGPPYPYHPKYGAAPHPYVEGGIDVLDRAFDWARANGQQIVLDLHAAPGCQNGFDNGGIAGVCEWHTREEFVAHSVSVLARLAERYRASDALGAIEVLNEPRWDVPTPFLVDYYERAYAAIRAHCRAEKVAVVFHDGFRSHREFGDFLRPGGLANAVLDVHRYQCFTPDDVALDAAGHLQRAVVDWRAEAEAIQRELGRPAIAGEWSLGLDPNGFVRPADRPPGHPLRGLDAFQEDVLYRAYGAAQLLAFERYWGWFFWSYRTESSPAWCFRVCVERGWLPARYG